MYAMLKKEKVAFVMHTLDALYPEIPIPLDHSDPYTLLIAVLLSAQSTDVRVNQNHALLFAKKRVVLKIWSNFRWRKSVILSGL